MPKPDTNSEAHKLAAKPDAELQTMIDLLPTASTASESQVVHERHLKDGSTLYVTSRQGGAVKFDARPPTPPPESQPVPSS